MRVIFRAPSELLAKMNGDLRREHGFAYERVGWVAVRGAMADDTLVLLAHDYLSVPDDQYVDDRSVGAMLGQEAIKEALNTALLQSVGMFHVHIHDHQGAPKFSPTDSREQARFVPDFFAVQRRTPHGAIVFSRNAATGRVWLTPQNVRMIDEFHSVGAPSWFGLAPRKRGLFA